MDYQTSGATDWNLRAAEMGTVLELSFTCPTCGRNLSVRLQKPPWHIPHPDELDETGNVNDSRRAAGEVLHIEHDEIKTQVWCHLCQRGADVAVGQLIG
jgi:hypothetical protein